MCIRFEFSWFRLCTLFVHEFYYLYIFHTCYHFPSYQSTKRRELLFVCTFLLLIRRNENEHESKAQQVGIFFVHNSIHDVSSFKKNFVFVILLRFNNLFAFAHPLSPKEGRTRPMYTFFFVISTRDSRTERKRLHKIEDKILKVIVVDRKLLLKFYNKRSEREEKRVRQCRIFPNYNPIDSSIMCFKQFVCYLCICNLICCWMQLHCIRDSCWTNSFFFCSFVSFVLFSTVNAWLTRTGKMCALNFDPIICLINL